MKLVNFESFSHAHKRVSSRFLSQNLVPVVIEKEGFILKKFACLPETTISKIRSIAPELRGLMMFIRTDDRGLIIESSITSIGSLHSKFSSSNTGYLHLVADSEPSYG